MARYKVDKKLFEQKQLEEELKQIELQSKYLKDEPLKRSEVDSYNKLKANSWVKNTLVSFGIIFVTLIAGIIFILLGALLFKPGYTGIEESYNIDSYELKEFLKSEYEVDLPDPLEYEKDFFSNKYNLPKEYLSFKRDENGNYIEIVTKDEDGNIINKDYERTIDHYGLITIQYNWNKVNGKWVLYRNPSTGTYGVLNPDGNTPQDYREDILKYTLDASEEGTRLTTLLDNFFESMKDGSWAKWIVSSEFLGSSSFLVVVLYMFYFATIIGYALVLVVGIRYVVKTFITILRKAGYIASDFVTEFVGAVKDELPIIDTDPVEEISFTSLKKQLEDKLSEDKAKWGLDEEEFFIDEDKEEVVEKTVSKKNRPKKEVIIEDEFEDEEAYHEEVVEKPVEEDNEDKRKEETKSKIDDIFSM